MDAFGLIIGIISFMVVSFIIYFLLERHDLNRLGILRLVSFCGIGHFLGGLAYYWFTITSGSDSLFYFENAKTTFEGLGYHFAFFFLGYLRMYLIGDSLLGMFMIFSSISFLGSTFYLLIYKNLLDRMCCARSYYFIDSKILSLPSLLLLCWPSYFFWSVGLKDNFAFFSVSSFLFFLVQKKTTFLNLTLLFFACIIAFFIRPYLFIIAGIASLFFILFNTKWRLSVKIALSLSIAYFAYTFLPSLEGYGSIVTFSGDSLDKFTKYAIQQQRYMNIGTSIPIPTENPRLLLLFLPYLFVINLCLPLLIGATNILGIISSIENFYLIGWIIYFLRNKTIWDDVKNDLRITGFFMNYFLIGMSFLSLMNTNLGLAMREKMMFVPSFLIIILLVYARQRIMILEYLTISSSENHNEKQNLR